MKNSNQIQLAEYEVTETQEINLRELWEKMKRRRSSIISVTLAVFILGSFWTFVQKPVYTAKSTLLIEKEPNILSFEQVFQVETLRDDFYQTQYRLLESRSLAETVVERLKLWQEEEFAGKRIKARDGVDPQDHVVREKLIDGFLDRLNVKPIRMTRLMEVTFNSRNPRLAAACINTLVDSFIDFNINQKYAATEQASQFLAEQIQSMQKEIETKEKQLQELEAQANIIALSDKETTVIDRLSELNKALTEAQIERVRNEAIWNELKNASADYIPEAIRNPLIQRLREDYVKLKREYEKMQDRFQPDYPELQRLKIELEAARKSLDDETQNLVRSAYSEFQTAMKKERSLAAVFEDQKQEAFKMNSSAVLYNGLKIEIQNKKNLLDSLLRRQSETGVEARLKGLRSSNIQVVDRARVPVKPSKPNKKLNLALALMLGLFGGFGLAVLFEMLDTSIKNAQDIEKYTGLATLGVVPRFSLEGTKKGYYLSGGHKKKALVGKAPTSSDLKLPAGTSLVETEFSGDIEKQDGKEKIVMNVTAEDMAADKNSKAGSATEEAAVLVDKSSSQQEPTTIELVPFYFPTSRLAEKYRTIRTALLLSSADRPVKSVVITSPLMGEGKSVTAANLAITLAQSGKTVILVDADLRKPRQHRIFRQKNIFGLTSYLTDSVDMGKLIRSTLVPNLFLINAGPLPPNPAELLGSEKMGKLIKILSDKCDYMLFDTPPIIDISDPLVLAAKVDGVILVVWGNKTSREVLKTVSERLDMLKIKPLGVVINNVKQPTDGYYYKDYYYRYDM